MENPNTWTDLERGIQQVIDEHARTWDKGAVGLSLARTLADYVRERDRLLRLQESPVLEDQLEAVRKIKQAYRKVFGS